MHFLLGKMFSFHIPGALLEVSKQSSEAKRTQRTKSTSWPSISHTLSLACFKSFRCDRSSIYGECIPQGAHARHGGAERMSPRFCPLRAHRRRKPTLSSLPQPCDPEQVLQLDKPRFPYRCLPPLMARGGSDGHLQSPHPGLAHSSLRDQKPGWLPW